MLSKKVVSSLKIRNSGLLNFASQLPLIRHALKVEKGFTAIIPENLKKGLKDGTFKILHGNDGSLLSTIVDSNGKIVHQLRLEEFDEIVSATIGNSEMSKVLQAMYQSGNPKDYADALLNAEVQEVLSKREKISQEKIEQGMKLLLEDSDDQSLRTYTTVAQSGAAAEAVQRYGSAVKEHLVRLDSLFLPLIIGMENAIATHGTDFRAFSDDEKHTVAAAVSIVGAIKAVLDTPILTEDGKLTDESAAVAEDISARIEK